MKTLILILLFAAIGGAIVYLIVKACRQKADTLSAEEYLTKASDADENGRYKSAIKYYQKAVAIDPNYAAAYYNMGIAYDDLKDYSEAIRSIKKPLTLTQTLQRHTTTWEMPTMI
jgi:tetratricopeptide (TPR) repeat protein